MWTKLLAELTKPPPAASAAEDDHNQVFEALHQEMLEWEASSSPISDVIRCRGQATKSTWA